MESPQLMPRSTRRFALRSLLATAVVCLLILGILMLFEEMMIFPAPRYPTGNWQPAGFSYEDVFFDSEDGTRLHGWYFPHAQPRGHLLYCHGNGDCVAYLGDYGDDLRRRYDLSVFVFDYRGYGRSAGKPHEAGVLRDARAAQSWLADRVGRETDEIILMGRSLGGSVVVSLAAELGAKALVLQSTFTSMPDVAAVHYPFIPVRRLMRTQFNSLENIRRYRGPVLQSHGGADEIIPLELGRNLFEAIPGPKEFFVADECGHNSMEPPAYDRLLAKFFDRICQ